MIKDYEFTGSLVRVTIDTGDVFAYPIDKFESVDKLEREISKKLVWRSKRALKDKKLKLEDDFKDKNVKEKVKEDA